MKFGLRRERALTLVADGVNSQKVDKHIVSFFWVVKIIIVKILPCVAHFFYPFRGQLNLGIMLNLLCGRLLSVMGWLWLVDLARRKKITVTGSWWVPASDQNRVSSCIWAGVCWRSLIGALVKFAWRVVRQRWLLLIRHPFVLLIRLRPLWLWSLGLKILALIRQPCWWLGRVEIRQSGCRALITLISIKGFGLRRQGRSFWLSCSGISSGWTWLGRMIKWANGPYWLRGICPTKWRMSNNQIIPSLLLFFQCLNKVASLCRTIERGYKDSELRRQASIGKRQLVGNIHDVTTNAMSYYCPDVLGGGTTSTRII